MRISLPAVAAAALLASGCGYVGDPLPPLANIPSAVQELTATQRGATIQIEFPVPKFTTENMPIREALQLDLRIGTYGSPFDANGWAAQAARLEPASLAEGVARYETPSAPWTGKDAIIGVRTAGPNGKESNWSNFVVLPVVPPPQRPRNVHPEATPGGVRLTWEAQGQEFRIFRQAAGEGGFTVAAETKQPEWTDENTEFGRRYAYRVETVVKLAAGREALSLPSDEAAITPEDVFPPSAPAGLTAAAAPESIELSWEPNGEKAVAGYRVYRSAGGRAFEKIADVGLVPTYSDRSAKRGEIYRYEITAVGGTGHESKPSPPVEAELQ